MKFVVVDLFCGAGGTSTGATLAIEQDLGCTIDLLAINHWKTAVNSHSLNHPHIRHLCETLDNVTPRQHVRGGRAHLLCASPECTGHSNAAGGMPRNEQSRATAWHVSRWCSDLIVDNIQIENVWEFLKWGPLLRRGIKWRGKLYQKGKPDPRREGEFFNAWVNSLRAMGYCLEWRKQCAATFGDPTTRERFIMLGSLRSQPVWPEPTHGPGLLPYRSARNHVVDWSLKGIRIDERTQHGRPELKDNTIDRITGGFRKFSGAAFVMNLRGTSDAHLQASAHSLDEPLGTISTSGKHHSLVEPFMVQIDQTGGNGSYSCKLDKPLNTLTTKANMLVVEPFIVHSTHHGKRPAHSVDNPLPTVTGAKRGELTLVKPFLVTNSHGADKKRRGNAARRAHDIGEPVPTLTTVKSLTLVEPFIIPNNYGERKGQKPRSHSIDKPLPTVVGTSTHSLVEPMLIGQQSCAAARTVDQPAPTIAAKGAVQLVQPFFVPYYGTGVADSVDEPLATLTTRDRFLLVTPEGGASYSDGSPLPRQGLWLLTWPDGTQSIWGATTRMLQAHEAAAAMSFPKGYVFTGTKEDQMKQIGNAVPVELARAHTRSVLKAYLTRRTRNRNN